MGRCRRRGERQAGCSWAANAALLASANPLLRMTSPNLLAIEREWRRVRAALRVLRISLALHQDQEPPDLDDPVGGGRIRVEAGTGGVRIACAPLDEGEDPSRLVVR